MIADVKHKFIFIFIFFLSTFKGNLLEIYVTWCFKRTVHRWQGLVKGF